MNEMQLYNVLQEKGIDVGLIKRLDDFFKVTQHLGSKKQTLTNALYGLNNQPTIKPYLPVSNNLQGYTFFTRPMMNFTTVNLRNDRSFYNLLNKREDSIQSYVRNMLDPMLDRNNKSSCPYVDPFNPFIPILSNTIKTVTGFPDMVLPTLTTDGGLKKEQWSMVDGIVDIYSQFDLEVTFKNTREEPSVLLFTTWLKYMAAVYEGILEPYMGLMLSEIDYNTRIYRVILNAQGNKVAKLGAVGAAIPLNVPSGNAFDLNDEDPYTDDKEMTIRFSCVGAMYNDDILVKEFNDTVSMFNPDMRKINEGFPTTMTKLNNFNMQVNNYRAYPRINPHTMEFEWWVTDDEMKRLDYL